jgi:hypothetical protein
MADDGGGWADQPAVRVARRCIQDGLVWVVDIDLDRFFDRVQFDVLMARVARKVEDRKVLRLIRRYLEAGVMVDGVRQPTAEVSRSKIVNRSWWRLVATKLVRVPSWAGWRGGYGGRGAGGVRECAARPPCRAAAFSA